jgi:hypothetical protein
LPSNFCSRGVINGDQMTGHIVLHALDADYIRRV